MDKDLLSEEQSQIFSDMIRDIVKQVKNNPKQAPVVTIPHKYRQVSQISFILISQNTHKCPVSERKIER